MCAKFGVACPVQKGLCDVREECFARIVSTRTVNVGRCRCCRSTLCSLANPPVSLKPHTKNLRESTCEEKTSLQTSSSSKPKGKFPLNLSTPAPKQVPRFQSLGVRWLLGLGLGTPSSEFGHIRLEDVKTESMAFRGSADVHAKTVHSQNAVLPARRFNLLRRWPTLIRNESQLLRRCM